MMLLKWIVGLGLAWAHPSEAMDRGDSSFLEGDDSFVQERIAKALVSVSFGQEAHSP